MNSLIKTKSIQNQSENKNETTNEDSDYREVEPILIKQK